MEIFPTWYFSFIGVIIPVIVNFVTKKTWNRHIKSAFALGISIIISFGGLYLAGKIDTVNILATIGTVFTVSQLAYDQIWKGKI